MTATYETVTFENGTSSLKVAATGQMMHSRIGPWEEANQIYIQQSLLREKIMEKSKTALVLHDVGLGIAANALAAIACAESLPASSRRVLHIISFETDPSALALALDQSSKFEFLIPKREALRALLKTGNWQSSDGKIRWSLISSDYRLSMKSAPSPEIIYFDFYAPQTCPDLWGLQIFKNIYESTLPLRNQKIPTRLATYSAATPVRVALLLAGFYVGYGTSTGIKSETTLASTHLSDLEQPLGSEWLAKLERSEAPVPYGWNPERAQEAHSRILTCGQFV